MASKTTLTIAVAVIILIVIAGVAIYLGKQKPETPTETTPATSPSPTPTPSPSPTKPTTPTPPKLTGDVETDIVAIAKYLAANGITTVKFKVWGAGDPNSVLRTLAVVEAAYRLNKILSDKGVDFKIEIEETFRRGGGDKLAEDFATAFAAGNNPDIMANSYKHLARFAEEGYILALTDYLNTYSKFRDDFYASLLDAVKYKGEYYAVPQDTEARPLYFRTDVAQCIKEKTGKDILAGLADKVKGGEVTWKDIYEYAKMAVESGCSEWGVIHRKGSAHPDLIQFIFAYGGVLEDPATGKLVLPVEAIYKWLYTEWKFAQDKITPSDMMAWDWAKQIHPTTVNGKTLVWIGGTWHWTEWQTKPYYTDPSTGENRPLTAEEVKKYFYYTLFPAGEPGLKPVTLSQPFVWYIASNAGKDNPKYDELKEVYHMLAFLLVVKANDPDLVAIHGIISAHLPTTKSSEALMKDKTWVSKLANLEVELSDEVKTKIADIVKRTVNDINVEFLASAGAMLEYTKFTPIHPLYPRLADIFKDAVDKVLRGEMKPEEAVNYIIDKIKADPDLAESVEVRGEIPSGWSFP